MLQDLAKRCSWRRSAMRRDLASGAHPARTKKCSEEPCCAVIAGWESSEHEQVHPHPPSLCNRHTAMCVRIWLCIHVCAVVIVCRGHVLWVVSCTYIPLVHIPHACARVFSFCISRALSPSFCTYLDNMRKHENM